MSNPVKPTDPNKEQNQPRNLTATIMKDRLDHLHTRLSKMESYVEKIMDMNTPNVPAVRQSRR